MESRKFEDQLRACADGQLSIADFEAWFEIESWNIHKRNDQCLIDSVFEVEEAISLYSDNRLGADEMRSLFAKLAGPAMASGLANTIRPFDPQSDFAHFYWGPTNFGMQTAGSNSTSHSTCVVPKAAWN
jgi:hypothetical protein